MSSPQFPTYGRGDEPDRPDADHYAQPAPYGPGGYGGSNPNQPGPNQPGPNQPPYGPPPGQYSPPPGQYSAPPDQYGGQPGPGQYGVPQQGADYSQPPGYRPGHPYGEPTAHPQQQLPTYGRDEVSVPRDRRAARVLLAASIISAVYGLLVLSVQRVSLREISQAPGSALNHPVRTDVIDTIGQVLVVLVGLAALVMWLRDVLNRRKVGRAPDPFELGGLALVAVSVIPLLVWLIMVVSTGMGAIDDSLDRLPTAYGWGGTGLLILAVGFALGYRELKPEVSNPVVLQAPDRPPWE